MCVRCGAFPFGAVELVAGGVLALLRAQRLQLGLLAMLAGLDAAFLQLTPRLALRSMRKAMTMAMATPMAAMMIQGAMRPWCPAHGIGKPAV